MNFEEAEARFRQLQARVQRGEPISRAEYEEQVSQLAVQDQNGVLWEINPRTGKWMYFDGAEWVAGTPPGHDNSTVMPLPGASTAAPTTSPPPAASVATTPPQPTPKPVAPAPLPVTRPAAASAPAPKAPAAPEPVQAYRRVGQDKKPAPAKPSGGAPSGGAQPLARPPKQNGGSGRNREWVPLAIGAVVLLACAILLFVGGNFALSALSPAKTPTRVALPPTVPPTAVPTIVRLPSPTPLPPTPEPVMAKVIERTVNVRATPSTAAKKVAELKKDKALTLLVKSAPLKGSDGKMYTWYQVNVEGLAEPGWVREDTIQITSGDAKTLPTSGPTPTPTKAAGPPPPAQPTATLTPIGGAAPTRKP